MSRRALLVRAIDQYLQDCFAASTAVRVDELAQRLDINPSSLSRAFRKSTGMRLSEYLKDRQIEHAKRLLTATAMPMQEIALCTGFGTPNTFYRLFRWKMRTTPAAFRRLTQKDF